MAIKKNNNKTTQTVQRTSAGSTNNKGNGQSTTKLNGNLPTNELNQWLKGRTGWSHSDWLALLDQLRSKGYKQLADSASGQKAIGDYLNEEKLRQLKLPKSELQQWLKGRTSWTHNEWMDLLATLQKRGYRQITESEFGRAAIGSFLEENRRN